MLQILKKVYNLIPPEISLSLLKLTGLSPIFSKKHWKQVEGLKSENDKPKIANSLNELADQIENLSFYNSPKYANFLKFHDFENLKEVPIIDSSIVRENLNSLTNKKVPGYYTTTGGSGRNPLKIYLSNKSYFQDRIHVFYAWSKLGYSRGDLKLTLRGVNLNKNLYRFNPMNNELLINIFLLNEKNLPEIIKIINKYKPVFGHGYPSAWYNLAFLIKNSNFTFINNLKGIYFASETIDPVKRDFVEEVFKKPVRSTYGFTERAGFAFELTKKKNYYRVCHEYGLIEVITEDGRDAKVGERGEIVCTGFINKGMPLLRYKPGDSALVGKIENGLVTELKDIEGRWGKDFIIDAEGTEIYTTAINLHSPGQFDFRYIQLVQNREGYLIIKFVPFSKFKTNSLKDLKEEFQKKMPYVSISTEVVELENLFITKRGKIPFLVKDYKDE